MDTDEKTVALESYLGGLPKAAAVRLARTVELDALNDGALPHDAILSLLRPALRGGGETPRLPSPLRSFCLPFEDLLCSGPRKAKRRGCVSRSSILPVWKWLMRDLVPDAVTDYVGDYKSFTLAGETASADQCAYGFWQLAGEAITDAFAVDPDAATERLGNESVALDAEEMGLLLTAGPLMAEVKTLLHKPARGLNDRQVEDFRALYDRALVEAPDVAPYLPVAAMGRLDKPWLALRLALAVSRRRGAQRAATDMGLVGEILFARLEDARTDIVAARNGEFDPDVLIDRLTEFALLSSAIGAELDILRSGRWGKRLLADRTAVAGIMDACFAHSVRAIAAAMPLKRCHAGRHALVPDFDVAFDAAATEGAVRYVRLLAGCRYLATAAGFAGKYAEAYDAAADLIRFYRAAAADGREDAGPERHAHIDNRIAIASALSRILFGKDEAVRQFSPDTDSFAA